MGIIVNFTAGTVQGFGDDDKSGGFTRNYVGSINRVTGDLQGGYSLAGKGHVIADTDFELKCKPVRRMF